MGIQFTPVERYVLKHTGGYSKQLIAYWEKSGAVPSKHVLRVHQILGRSLKDLLGGNGQEEESKPKKRAAAQ